MIWFTSDDHFAHSRIIEYCKRPFKDFREMDEALIANWNSAVKQGDDIYNLGDFACGPDATEGYITSIFHRLNGNIHLIDGNHDRKKKKRKFEYLPFASRQDSLELFIGKHMFVLAHWPQQTWNEATHGSFHLFGHVHGKVKGMGRSMDVGVDSNDFRPLSIDEVISTLQKLPIVQVI